jgi:hypothetical protein
MALTPAQKQQRSHDRLKARSEASPEAVEAALMAELEQYKQGPSPDVALADKLADLAMRHLWRSQELSRIAMKVRAGQEL